ncbi:heparinase II/III family protein [Rheinheimera sp. UJ51]|uniref:alginate lyase family protein n=1 Tax=Rheinheimera sp. UJ51 TaxID=2892446 RepID=UPI001E2A4FAA|nr:alginate lyase family protein [Rheinheimera sp. UJ51]MCC5451185.1 heparinase II/III family protein [Rheinheimera sp. UJ51]
MNTQTLTSPVTAWRRISQLTAALLAVATLCWHSLVLAQPHPNLVLTAADIIEMRTAIQTPSLFTDTFNKTKARIDKQLTFSMEVPVPKDAGGGYTHERHKKNAQLMYDAAIVFQLTEQNRYAHYVRDMLLKYAALYPTLPRHPMRKSSNEGKLFWQGLNEAVWLVYTIQAYDLVYNVLSAEERHTIEQGIIRPVARFLSIESPQTFNKVHNHGTWATAAVGMTGYVLSEPEFVETALLDLSKSGKGGFLRQLQALFSPQGYYNEGPYYQRYALLPFVTFAKAIQVNQPERDIFGYRDGVLLKAIDTTIQLSYNGLFFPLNDAIKNKGIDTIELVTGVAMAYGLNGDTSLLDIAQRQNTLLLTGDGLKVARDLAANKATPYRFNSIAYGDGKDGNEGALVVMRSATPKPAAVVFKATAQGLGHGHFDKLNWQFYDAGAEIVTDYGAVRFLNVEAKDGGGYLNENKTWAKQTVAHNTLVVNEQSHFAGNTKTGNQHHPELHFFATNPQGSIASASMDTAYKDTQFTRTMALITLPDSDLPLVVDILKATAKTAKQFDLPLHYHGQLIETNFKRDTALQQMQALGKANGYEHLWLTATGKPDAALAKITWLNDNGRFYTLNTANRANLQVLFTQLGANDPNNNLRNERAFILRSNGSREQRFVSVLEPHGEYNPSNEFTLDANSKLVAMNSHSLKNMEIIDLQFKDNRHFLLAYRTDPVNGSTSSQFTLNGKRYSFSGRFALLHATK